MSGQHFKFTNTNIKNLPTPDKRTFYYDTVEPKLSIQITPNGAKSFYIRQRVQGLDTRVKLGSFPEMTVEEARIASVKNRKMMNDGENPNIKKRQYKDDTLLQQLYDDFIEDRERYLSERTMLNYKRIWNSKLCKLGKKHLKEITGDMLKEIHRQITVKHGSYIANHFIKLVNTMFNYAIKEERFEGRNPAFSVKLNKVEARVRYLEHNELKRFMETVDAYEDDLVKDVILMLIFTGARRSNVFEMRWKDIDLDAKIWKIPQTKTANNVTIALADEAMKILRRRQLNKQNGWVFHSLNSKSGHVMDIKKSWAIILRRANITNFRLHDLRHTLGTYLAANGADAFMIKRILIHKNLQSTQIYVNLGVEHLRAILNDTVEKMIKIGKE